MKPSREGVSRGGRGSVGVGSLQRSVQNGGVWSRGAKPSKFSR